MWFDKTWKFARSLTNIVMDLIKYIQIWAMFIECLSKKSYIHTFIHKCSTKTPEIVSLAPLEDHENKLLKITALL